MILNFTDRKSRFHKKESTFYPTGFNTFFMGNQSAQWINSQNLVEYATIVTENPVIYSAIDLSARYFSDGRVNLKDLKTGEIITQENITSKEFKGNEIVKKAFRLFNNPNVLTSNWEYLQTYIYMKKTFGNAFTYANKPVGFKTDIKTVESLWNIWPQYMNVVLTGKNYFNATDINEIIKEWKWGLTEGGSINFQPDEILHRKEPKVRLRDNTDMIFGESKLRPLQRPISNIALSYESENVVLRNRGARLLMSMGSNTEIGIVPAEVSERDELQKDWAEYGLKEDQYQAMITRMPVDITVIDQDIRKLGIFETIAHDTMIIAHAFGIPEILIKMYIQGATFANQEIAVRRMYQDTTIPEFNDYISDLNQFLKLPDYGYEYVPTWEHISVLQKNYKDKAIANRNTSTYMKDVWLNGGCTYNVWLKSIGLKEQDGWGDKRIFELTPEEIIIITGNISVTNTSIL